MKKIIDMLKSMTNSKKKVFALALSVCIVVLSIAGSSIAYFTDTKEYTNTFTSGNVEIALYVNDADFTNVAQSSYEDAAFPGKVIDKSTVIKNVGSESAFLGSIITVTGGTGILSIENDDGTATDDGKIYVASLFTGLPSAGVKVEELKDSGSNVIGFTIYVVCDGTYAKDAYATVFTDISIPASWDNDQMTAFKSVSINVKAYAVQTSGMDGKTELQALQLGFPGTFDTAVNP